MAHATTSQPRLWISGAGAPTTSTLAAAGATYWDVTNSVAYQNVGTATVPVWVRLYGLTLEDYYKSRAASMLGVAANNLNWAMVKPFDWNDLGGVWVNSSSGGTAAQNATSPGRMTFTTTSTGSRTFSFFRGNGTFGYVRFFNATTTKKWATGGMMNCPNAANFTANTSAYLYLRDVDSNGLKIGYMPSVSSTKWSAYTIASTARSFVSTVDCSSTDMTWEMSNDGAGNARFSVNGETAVTGGGAITTPKPCYLQIYGENGASAVECDLQIAYLWFASEV